MLLMYLYTSVKGIDIVVGGIKFTQIKRMK
jgi:hypothetical protein